MQLKIRVETLSRAWNFEFKSNNNQIIGIIIRSALYGDKGDTGHIFLENETLLLPLLQAIKNLSANPERSSAVILDGVLTTCEYIDFDKNVYLCTFNSPEPNTRAAEVLHCFTKILAVLQSDLPFLNDFGFY